jgi:ABC-type lipoprotein release transport system permease subunit
LAGKYVKDLGAVLYGVGTRDVGTIGLAVMLIALVSAVAGYLPARRASKVDPMVALHQQ